MALEIPGLDTNRGLELCDGNMKIYLNSLRIYASSIPASLEKMRSVSAETLKDYSINAHCVKGMSEYVGAGEVIKTARQLEQMAKSGDLAGILAQNEAFIKFTQDLAGGIQKWLIENNHL